MISSDTIRRFVLEEGFSLCGIARSRPMYEQESRLAGWLAKGYNRGLSYMERNRDKRIDPAILMPGAKTVIVCAVNYKNGAWNRRADRNKIASYALARDYHHTIKSMLFRIRDRIVGICPDINIRCFTDTAPILEKAWAVEAGLGCAGKNSLLITPGSGSFVLLGELLINEEADSYDKVFETDLCTDCNECIKACPNGAIRPGRVIDTGKCISRLTTEKLPEGTDHDPAMLHGWIFGCDICQNACPYNDSSPMHTLSSFDTVIDPGKLTDEFWQNLNEEAFDRIFGETPMARTGFEELSGRII